MNISIRITLILALTMALATFFSTANAAVIDLAPASPIQFATEATVNQTSEPRDEMGETTSNQRGYLLGIMRVTFKVKVITHDDGRVIVDYPWYSFLIVKEESIE